MRLRRGVTVEQAVKALEGQISDSQQASAQNASSAEVKRQAYLNWVSTAQRVASRARSAQFSFGRCGLLPLQDGELVAQEQDLRRLPCLLTPGQPQPRGDPRDQQEDEPQAHDR